MPDVPVTKTIAQLPAAAELLGTDQLPIQRGDGPAQRVSLQALMAFMESLGVTPEMIDAAERLEDFARTERHFKLLEDDAPPAHGLLVSQTGEIYVGVGADGYLIARLNPADPSFQRLIRDNVSLPARRLQSHDGSGPVFPIVTGRNGGVALGFDAADQVLIGAFPTGLGAGGAADQARPLAAPDRIERLTAGGWNGFLSYGQSLSVGGAVPSVVSDAQPYANLTFGGGVASGRPGNTAGAVNTAPGTTTTRPLVEVFTQGADGFTAGETQCSQAANFLNLLAARDAGVAPAELVTFASAPGHGGYPIAYLREGGLLGGSEWYRHLLDHVSEAKARATAAGKPYQVNLISWMQGESDSGLPTHDPGVFAYYLAQLRALRSEAEADIRAITGQAGPVHLLTYQTPSNATFGVGVADLRNLNQVQLAQAEAARVDPRIHLVGPLYHLMRGSPDGVHLGAVQSALWGRYVARAAKALLIDGVEPPIIRPIAAVARGVNLTIRFEVPRPPLVLDAGLVGAIPDGGFRVRDDQGVIALSAVSAGQDTVRMTLARPVGAGAVVRYGLDHIPTEVVIEEGAAGSLRDSTTDAYRLNGQVYALPHACPHFEQPIIKLEDI